jgi:DNA-binding NarL/FixJ family response regulator
MRILVVDPHAIYRRGMVASLELLERVESVDQAEDVASAQRHPALGRVQLVFLDTSIPGARDFVSATAAPAGPHVIACTYNSSGDAVVSAIEAGAIGYLRKDTLTQEVLQAAVQAASSGAGIVAPDVLDMVLRLGTGEPVPTSRFALTQLSERERRVLALIAEGHPTREVAEELSYSERTVKNVLHDVVVKLNARSRSQAVAQAVRGGLI